MILSGNMMKLQPLQLPTKGRVAGFTLSVAELCHQRERFEILLQRAAERDLTEPLVDILRGLR